MDNTVVTAKVEENGDLLIPNIVPKGGFYPAGSVIFYVL
jgi:hypothetical protein